MSPSSRAFWTQLDSSVRTALADSNALFPPLYDLHAPIDKTLALLLSTKISQSKFRAVTQINETIWSARSALWHLRTSLHQLSLLAQDALAFLRSAELSPPRAAPLPYVRPGASPPIRRNRRNRR